MKNVIVIFLLLVILSTSEAQSEAEPTNEPTPSAYAIAQFLRNQYGISQSAYFTQMAWELSHSFASVDQLKQQWQQALETEITEHQLYNRINTHALMAQTMIQFSNGMNLHRWRMVDLNPLPYLPGIKNKPSPEQSFQIWVNLPYFWQQIIDNSPQQTFQWLTWPELTFSSEVPEDNEDKQSALSFVLNWVSNNPSSMTEHLNETDPLVTYYDNLSIALIRQQHHAIHQQYLALGNDWIEIYQLIELSPMLLTAQQQKHLATIINRTEQQWQAASDTINQIDGRFFNVIKMILLELPNKFKNPDHINSTLNQQIVAQAFDFQDISAYFNHPLRQNLQENLEVCLNLSVSQSPEPNEPIADNQFKSCLNEFMEWANDTAKDPSFSGNQIRLDNATSLHRALEMPSVQMINILSMQAVPDEDCQQQLTPSANLFEWLLAAESVAWFHDRWPGIFADKETISSFENLIIAGQQLNHYPECFVNSAPLSQQFLTLKSKWEKLKQVLNQHIDLYINDQLSPNTDINLFGSIDQKTNYIPEGLTITPCHVSTSCGAFIELDPGIDLMELFPNHLKLASQFGLGELSICYDQVEWQNRKTAPTHLDNNKIANFEGQLSIQMNGLYQGNKVFTKQLVSDQRHIYLFGENNQETLDMACPLAIIGKQINTSLDRGTFGLLPNRLTFLTAQKVDINKVINNNWSTWSATIGNDQQELVYFDEMAVVKSQLNDEFLKHVNQLQQQIYRKLISSNPSRINDSALSKATFEYLNHRKLINHLVTGLYPQIFHSNQAVRAALKGNMRMVDEDYFKAAFDSQTNVIEMMNQGDQLFDLHDVTWNDQNIQSGEVNSGFINATIEELQLITTMLQAD